MMDHIPAPIADTVYGNCVVCNGAIKRLKVR